METTYSKTTSFTKSVTKSIFGVFVVIGCVFGQSVGFVSLPLGEVLLQRNNQIDWKDAEFKMSVFEKDKVKTLQKSRCEIRLSNRRLLRIGENALIELKNRSGYEESIEVKSGKMWLNILLGSNDESFKVITPTSVCAIRGTIYRLSCDSIYTNYRVYKGVIAVNPTDEEGGLVDTTFVVNSGEELTLVNNFEEYKKRQEKAIDEFIKRELNEYEKYRMEQEESFSEWERKDTESFQQFKSFHYTSNKFDLEKDRQSDWVKWNLDRDSILYE
ncbi:MAG: FecR domain-containing protein [Bacteroidetes bacterium]|nr:FecR domain-containing protein [Bacteroidota bacterium]